MSSIFPEPSQTRLVTIIAQVDHGKTTLADNLIEANGIISERLAGTLRYLDSLQEEQRRGITMRTSAIGLSHSYTPGPKKDPLQMVIHLLDSPGHADFSTEVTSALQCCDGALLVVDAVEGLCARTHQVLREAFVHQLVPLLVINKIDRLCTELCLTPTEAYRRLQRLVESMNAASAAMVTSSRADQQQQSKTDDDEQDNIWTFDAARGNVIFCSAIHGWGFTIPSMARHLFRNKLLDIKPVQSRQFLFGDFKCRSSDGKIIKTKGDQDVTLFSQFVLEPVWEIYQAVSQASIVCGLGSSLFGNTPSNTDIKAKITASTPGMEKVQSIVGDSLSIMDILRQTGSTTEETVLSSVLRRYQPLSAAVLDAVCEICPSPRQASESVRTRALALQPGASPELQEAVSKCLVENVPVVTHVCKFHSTEKIHIRDPPPDAEGDAILLGVARVLSGVLKSSESYYCMGPKHDARTTTAPQRNILLYLLMGSSLVPVPQVPAGHLCAIYGLEDLQLKTVTLSSDTDATPLQGFDRRVRPLVKVNVEPEDSNDTEALEHGLVKLTLADGAVEVTATTKGERILACLGEIHLEQSLLDLETRYCGKEVKIRKSEPIVDFGETTDWLDGEDDYLSFLVSSRDSPPLRHTTIPPYNEEEGIDQARRGRALAVVSGKGVALGVRVLPLSDLVYQSLVREDPGKVDVDFRDDILKLGKALGFVANGVDAVFMELLKCLRATSANGNALIESTGVSSGRCIKGIVAEELFSGVKKLRGCDRDADDEAAEESEQKVGLKEYNLLLDKIQTWKRAANNGGGGQHTSAEDKAAIDLWKNQMSGSLVAGFRLGVRSGPICEEPLHQILVVLESVEIALQLANNQSYQPSRPLSGGMIIGAMKEGIRSALLSRPARLLEGQLKLTLHSSLNGLGGLYAVLSKRRGKVLEDSMVDGTDLLLITATLPQAESFGLAPELLRKTSGEVTVPELTFWKWQRLDEDPFWIPTSLEEREDFGEILVNGDSSTGMDNTALKYIRLVRERKGLLVDSAKTVVAAEKQRTMKR
jgi:ribosome assembly protein 1